MKFFIAIVLTLFFAFSAFAQAQAEVIVTSTFLRKSPDVASEKVQTVQKGDFLIFEKSKDTNGWYYVSTSDRTIKGWIRKDTVRRVSNAEKVNQTPTNVIAAPTPTPVQPVRTLPIVTSTPAVRTLPIVTSTPDISSPVVNPSPSPASTPTVVEEDNEVVRVDTEEVSLNVRVVDGNNRSVNNLEQSQFRVYEDDVLQSITSLGTAEVPIINALVIDNSRSLRTQLGKIIDAGKIIISTNRPKDESVVVRFVSKDKIEVVQDFTTNKNSLNNALDNLFVEGGQTAIIDAIYRTAKKVDEYQKSQKKEDVKLRSLILVSDGEDRGSSYKEQQLFELLRQSQVQIYAVGFVNDLSREDANGINRQEKAKSFLTRLAQETGGKVYFPGSIDELPQIASDISGEMRTQYLISYEPTNGSRDGTFRKIKVEIVDGASKEKRIAITRAGRNAAPK
jgi:Ca-activated chloride channel family protein